MIVVAKADGQAPAPRSGIPGGHGRREPMNQSLYEKNGWSAQKATMVAARVGAGEVDGRGR